MLNQLNNGQISLNEYRTIKNLPTIKDDNADRYRMPSNLTYIDEEPQQPMPMQGMIPTQQNPPEENDDDDLDTNEKEEV